MRKLIIIGALFLSFIITSLTVRYLLPQPPSIPVSQVALQVKLRQSPDKHLTLTSLYLQETYPSDYKVKLKDNFYTVQQTTENGEVLFSGQFTNTSVKIFDVFPGKSPIPPISTNMEEITLLLPYYLSARKIKFLDEANRLKLEVSINKSLLEPIKINRDLCGNGICDFNENFLTCYRDCL